MFLFTLAFLAPRVANLHALEHINGEEDSISCEVCDVIAHTHQVDLYGGDVSSFEVSVKYSPNSFVTESSYETPFDKILIPTTFCNRPPPSI